MKKIYVLCRDHIMNEVIAASSKVEGLLDYYKNDPSYLTLHVFEGEKKTILHADEVIDKYIAGTLKLPRLNWEEVIETCNESGGVIVEDIKISVAESSMTTPGEINIGVWEYTDNSLSRIIFYLSSVDLRRAYRDPNKIEKLLKEGVFDINWNDSIYCPYPCSKIQFGNQEPYEKIKEE